MVEHLDWNPSCQIYEFSEHGCSTEFSQPCSLHLQRGNNTTFLVGQPDQQHHHNTYNTVLIASDLCSDKQPCSCLTPWFPIQSRIVLVYSLAPHCSQPLHIKFSVSRVSDSAPVLFLPLVDRLYRQFSVFMMGNACPFHISLRSFLSEDFPYLEI